MNNFSLQKGRTINLGKIHHPTVRSGEAHGEQAQSSGRLGDCEVAADGQFCRWDYLHRWIIPWLWQVAHIMTSGVVAQVIAVFIQHMMSFLTGHHFVNQVEIIGVDSLNPMNFFPQPTEIDGSGFEGSGLE